MHVSLFTETGRGSRASKLHHWTPAESKESVGNIGQCVSWQPRRTLKAIAVKRREQLKCEMRLCSDEHKKRQNPCLLQRTNAPLPWGPCFEPVPPCS